MALMDRVREEHVTTETEAGLACWTCTLAANEAVPYPCPTVARAEELDAMTPLEDTEA